MTTLARWQETYWLVTIISPLGAGDEGYLIAMTSISIRCLNRCNWLVFLNERICATYVRPTLTAGLNPAREHHSVQPGSAALTKANLKREHPSAHQSSVIPAFSGHSISSYEGTWVLSRHDSRAAPQTVQTASPVCGTKNFSSVRLYSAPQLH